MIKRVIFDLDNTLIVPNYYDMKKCLLENINNLDIEFANQLNNLLYKYEEEHEKYTKSDLYQYLNQRSNINIPLNIFEKMIETTVNIPKQDFTQSNMILKYLKLKKYEIVILTNWFGDIQYRKLKQANLLQYIDEIYSGEQYLKPYKQSFYNAIGKNLCDECIIIGDNLIKDAIEPSKLGIKAIYLQKNKDNEIQAINNQIITIRNLKELKKIL